jgi:hypothetical protein
MRTTSSTISKIAAMNPSASPPACAFLRLACHLVDLGRRHPLETLAA